jgi:hypothetical protein
MLTFAGVAAQTCVLVWALACDDSSRRSDVSVIDSGEWAAEEVAAARKRQAPRGKTKE